MYVRTDTGLGLFSADRTSIQSAIIALEGQQGTRAVAASFGAADRAFDFPF